MHRVFVEPKGAKQVRIPEEEQHHLIKVLRAREGEPFIGLEGHGRLFLCRLARSGQHWFGEIIEEIADPRESPLAITLAQSLIKKDKMEWIIQKAVELGVAEIIPMITWRTEVQLRPEAEKKRLDRWNKIVLEAVKQSRRTRIPKLEHPVELSQLFPRAASGFRLFLDEGGGVELTELINKNREATSCLVLIGPEGGWDEQDRNILEQHRIMPIHLGPRILRTETAAVAVLSILQCELGDL